MLYNVDKTKLPRVRNPKDLAEILAKLIEVEDIKREHFFVFGLNSRQKIDYIELVGLGSDDLLTIKPKDVYYTATHKGVHSLIIAHNHPSGELDPSEEDMKFTKAVKEAGDLLSIPLLDHIIVSNEGGFQSLKQSHHFIFD